MPISGQWFALPCPSARGSLPLIRISPPWDSSTNRIFMDKRGRYSHTSKPSLRGSGGPNGYVRNHRRARYGKALLRMFIQKPSVALKSILRTVEGATSTPTLPTDLSVLRDETPCRLLTSPEEVISKLTQLETAALSPDPSLPPGPPSPRSDISIHRQLPRHR